jgi:putative transcriptional regulator
VDIAVLRKALGLSQLEFGQLLGVHLMTVSKWERGLARPSPYQDALLEEFSRAAAASTQGIGTKIKARLAGRGAPAALRFLLAAAVSEEEDADAPGRR